MRKSTSPISLAVVLFCGGVLAGAGPSPKPAPSPSDPAPATQPYAATPPEFEKALKPLPLVTPSPTPRPLLPGEVEASALLTTLEGARSVSVRGADGKTRSVRAGEALETGDSLQTGEKASMRVSFEQGVECLLTPNTLLKIDSVDVPGPNGRKGVLRLAIGRGEARFLIEKPAKGRSDLDGPSSPLKLIVELPAGAVGVRGTDFVVSVEPESAWVRVITGTVELAKEALDLGALRPARVAGPSDQIELKSGKPLSGVEHYEAGMFVKELRARHEHIEAMWNVATRDGKTGRLKPKFAAFRARKADQLNLANGHPPAAIRRAIQEREAKEKAEREKDLQERAALEKPEPGKPASKRSAGSEDSPTKPAEILDPAPTE